MQTKIHPAIADQPRVKEADEILRKCVHCGFCTATCPTYQILGDELDGPRGRIYLIKNLLETNETDEKSVAHLDRCLTCRACETTCPSGVAYGRLLDIGREFAAEKVQRPQRWRLLSFALRFVVPRPRLFRPLLHLAQWLRPLLPAALKNKTPRIEPARNAVDDVDAPRVLLLGGCVQSVATPNVNAALQKVLKRQGVSSKILDAGCCGALEYHLSAHDDGLARVRSLIDQLSPWIDKVDHIVSSATGCGVTIRDYPEMLIDFPEYQEKARRLADKLADPIELVSGDQADALLKDVKVAVHTPCSMQHGMKMPGRIEPLLMGLGAEILPVADGHLCCGSAGSYSLMQPALSSQMQTRKITSLNAGSPDVIVTANIGCQLHLDAASDTPVMHWVELIADRL